MHVRLATVALSLSCLHVHAQQDCASAIPIDAGVHSVAAITGQIPDAPRCTTIDDGPAAHAIWYSYTATADTIVEITTSVFGQPQVDTRFHVYQGECSALSCVVGNDNGGLNGTSRASFNAVTGETYYIVFDDRWSGESFSFQLSTIYYVVGNTEAYLSFNSTFVNLQGLPRAVVDMDNDGLDDVVGVTQTLVNIHYQQQDGGLTSVAIPTDFAAFPASWSLCAGDLDRNGYKDLLYGGGYGVTFMFATPDGSGFIQRSGTEYVFSQRSNMVDINNDGHLDAFVCHDVAPNVFYLNDGLGNLQFHQGGLGTSCGNYGSIWVDYDNDGDMDLYVAKCGCDANDILMRNDGGGQFVQVAGPLGWNDFHQSWSSAWGDYDNDGDMDVLIGGSNGPFHFLMRNDGNGTFTDRTAGSGLDAFNMQSIEWVTHDFNNDGLLDIMGGGAIMVNRGDMHFAMNTYAPGVGAVGDVNNDGSLDVLGLNGLQLGVPNGNHWLRVALHGTVSNTDGIGARVTMNSALGQQIREVRSGDGFRYMSSIMPHFGLGTDAVIDHLTVHWPSGIMQELEGVAVDQTLHLTEPVSTSLAPEIDAARLMVQLDAGEQWLFVKVSGGRNVGQLTLLDPAGKLVGTHRSSDVGIPVGQLAPGIYTARLVVDDRMLVARFRKG